MALCKYLRHKEDFPVHMYVLALSAAASFTHVHFINETRDLSKFIIILRTGSEIQRSTEEKKYHTYNLSIWAYYNLCTV